MVPSLVVVWTDFEMLSARSVAGRFRRTRIRTSSEHAPLLRHSNGEDHHGETGTSI